VIWHLIYLALLVYIARKAQQMNRRNKTPWWWEIADAINRRRPGTF
jgi:hypothetical protein